MEAWDRNRDHGEVQQAERRNQMEVEVPRRKAEKAESIRRKLAEDMELIKRRNWSPEGSFTALELLPKEIWGLILEQIDSPNDLKNVWETCTLFQELVGDKYFTKVLFPSVLAVDSFRKALLHPFQRKHNILEEPLHNLSQLRLICHEWRSAVDQFYEDFVLRQTPDFDLARVGLSLKFSPTNYDLRRLDKLIENFEGDEAKGKVFFARNLSISIPPNVVNGTELIPSLQIFKLPRLLGLIGHQILRFEYTGVLNSYEEAGISLPEVYRRFLFDFLPFMPNLKILTWGLKEERDRGLGLNHFIGSNPFPTLANLDTFRFISHDISETQIEMEFFQAVVWPNPQIKHLTISSREYNLRGEQDPLLIDTVHTLDQIESIAVELKHSDSGFGEIARLLKEDWPLRKIKLEVHRLSSEDIRCLERFPTLECVHLNFNRFHWKDPGTLQLPNVKHFTYIFGEVGRSSCRTSVDFLFPMKMLESLEWRCRSAPGSNNSAVNDALWSHELIQFRGGLMDLNRSNIWDVFPYLKTVTVDPYFSERPRNVPKPRIYRRENRHVDQGI